MLVCMRYTRKYDVTMIDDCSVCIYVHVRVCVCLEVASYLNHVGLYVDIMVPKFVSNINPCFSRPTKTSLSGLAGQINDAMDRNTYHLELDSL
jgi:hypothetical protein